MSITKRSRAAGADASRESYRDQLAEAQLQIVPADLVRSWRHAAQPRLWHEHEPRGSRSRLH